MIMKKCARFIVQCLAALALLLALVPAGPTVTAAGSVVIHQGDSVSAIQTAIQNAINLADAGETVTVTGSKDDVADIMELTIPAGITVVWKAVYIGKTYLIAIASGGTFEVADGMIKATGDDISALSTYEDAAVVMSGGAVESDGKNSIAIAVAAGSITVNGGLVKATGQSSCAIIIYAGEKATINNGTIEAHGHSAQAIGGKDIEIIIDGGLIQNTGDLSCGVVNQQGTTLVSAGSVNASGEDSIGLMTVEGDMTISGGTVTAVGDRSSALHAYQGKIAVTGGAISAVGAYSSAVYATTLSVAAVLSGHCTGNYTVPAEIGLIVEADTLTIPASRDGSDTGLTILAGQGTAVWNTTGPIPVIVFTLNNGMIFELEWGALKNAPPPVPPTGDSGFMMWTLGATAALIGLVMVAALRRRKIL